MQIAGILALCAGITAVAYLIDAACEAYAVRRHWREVRRKELERDQTAGADARAWLMEDAAPSPYTSPAGELELRPAFRAPTIADAERAHARRYVCQRHQAAPFRTDCVDCTLEELSTLRPH